MIHGLCIPMRSDERALTLAAILEAIGPNDLVWRIFEFSGVGNAPRGMAMTDFEQTVREHGYVMTWEELTKFASETEQVWDCLIAGLDKADVRSHEEVLKCKLSDVRATIEGVDSTNWEVRSIDPILMQRFSSRIGVPGTPTDGGPVI